MSIAKMKAFVDARNTSPFNSNLQFQIDLEGVGLKLADLGRAYKLHAGGYRWDTPWGELYEKPGGRMEFCYGDPPQFHPV